ncbi:MAG: S-layer homology domain-containing protein [Gorillibacterium sp.]|nr:S-layer homology domain-containing protein [Gorillibacterium sp.]
MKIPFRKWLGITLIVALIAGFFPVMPAEVSAASPITITSPANNAKITKSPIDIVATVPSESMTRINEIFYRVQNLTTGTDTGVVKTKAARQTDTFEVTFSNVDLTEGTNEITVLVGEAGSVVSAPITVLYTPVTNITNLSIDSIAFENDRILPETQRESFMITGMASGASIISAMVNGAASQNYAQLRNDGYFYFPVEDANTPPSRSTTEFRLKPGDNDIIFSAKNGTQTYSARRHIIYDNGKPFPFEVKLTGTGGTGNSIDLTGSVPYQPATADPNVRLSAKLKFDNDISVTTVVYGQVFLNGVKVDDINVTGTGINVVKDAALSKAGKYNVYDYQYTGIAPTGRHQTLDIWMYDSKRGAQSNTFIFDYIPQDVPLIEDVYRDQLKTLPMNDTSRGTNSINEVPLKTYVQTRMATGIAVYIGTKKLTTGITSVGGVGSGLYEVDLSSLPDGTSTFKVVPLTGAIEQVSSEREYTVNITSVPYVIMKNVYNGMVIKDVSLAPISGKIEGTLVNLDSVTGDVKLFINGVDVSGQAGFTKPAMKSFAYTLGTTTFLAGKNSIKVQLIQNGRVVTESNYEIFQFSNEAPEFGEISLHAGNDAANKFIETARAGTYATNEAYVKLIGTYSPGVQSVRVTVKLTDIEGKLKTFSDLYLTSGTHTLPQLTGASVSETTNFTDARYYMKSGDAGSGTIKGNFETFYVKLPVQGQAVIEFEIKNTEGVAAIKAITISREPLPYEIISPMTTRNSKNIDQANVNSNFVDIKIFAESADSVVFGKTAALKDPNNSNLFSFTAEKLKKGSNPIKFTVNRGAEKLSGTLVVYNSDTAIVGAQYIAPISSKMKVFGGDVQLAFSKDTMLKRNKPYQNNSFLTNDRQILFGIADGADGRVDKVNHPLPSETIDNTDPYYIEPYQTGLTLLKEETNRYHPASPLYWIDGGTMVASSTSITKDTQQAFLTGKGLDPYSTGSSGLWWSNELFYTRTNKSAEVVPTNEGVLTIKYDQDIRNDAWRYLTVYHFEYFTDYRGVSGYRWRNVGGVVDLSAKTIKVPFTTFGYYRVMYMDRSFDDVISHPWAQNQLDTLYSKGIMSSKSSKNTFDPYDPISRGEFITMLVKVFEIKLDFEGDGTFNDVLRADTGNISQGLYEYKYIETAARKGIIRGTTGGTFLPDASITREEASVMIAKAANLKLNSSESKVLISLQKSFTDANLIQTYARTSIEAVVKAKLMSGMENALVSGTKKSYRYAPKDTFSRAEAAAVAINVMASQKKIPKQ